MPTLAALDIPPIAHASQPAALVLGLAAGLLALRAPMVLSRGPSAAWTHSPTSRWRVLVTAAVLSGAGFLSDLWVHGARPWPAVSSDQRLAWGTLGLGVLAIVLALLGVCGRDDDDRSTSRPSRLPGWISTGLASAILGMVGAAIAVWPHLRSGDTRPEALLVVLIGGMLSLLIAVPLGAVDRRGAGFSGVVVLAGVMLASAATLLGSGSITLGKMLLPVAIAGIGLAIASAIKHGASVGGAAMALGSALISSMLVAGVKWSSLPWYAAVVLAAAPLLGVLVDAVLFAGARSSTRAWVRIGVSAAVAALGVGLGVSIEGRG